MENLSTELLQEILSHLSCPDLLSLRFTNKYFSTITAPYVFSLLHFSGESRKEWHDEFGIQHSGRSKIVEYGNMKDVVEKVLPIAQHVKEFKFRPRFYRDGKLTHSHLPFPGTLAVLPIPP
jgi:hypothetical protein